MNVCFLKKEGLNTPFMTEDRIELYPDVFWDSSRKQWDDFGYQTTFQMKLFFQEKSYELPLIKILIENEKNTHHIFKEVLERSNSEYIQFPIADINYISLPTDTEFYSTLFSLLQKIDIVNILTDLHEASYIKNTSHLSAFAFMMKAEGFYNSLARDMTSKKALDYGWFIVDNRTLAKDAKFELHFQLNTYANIHKVEINFEKTIFPNNMNILIGSNGTGKSQTLIYLIDELLGIGATQQLDKIPVYNQIVAIAYSPFESYRTSLKNTNLKITSAYKYFGFREENGTFNQKLPFKNAIESILKMLKEDEKKDYFKKRPNKYDTFIKVISQAIEFDYIGFEINRASVDFQPYNANKIIDNKYYMIKDKHDFLGEVHIYDEKIKVESGIIFFKDNKVIDLSSGQQIFSQLISNILGSIREDTILLIDEPELYLHPNLEVELVGMLKELLDTYSSYAVIATHSSIMVREVARDYIAVLKRIENNIHISKPPFETFGGDMERINSYVFFDNDKIKPHEQWLKKLADQEANVEIAIDKYKSVLNEESLILMYGMGKDNAN